MLPKTSSVRFRPSIDAARSAVTIALLLIESIASGQEPVKTAPPARPEIPTAPNADVTKAAPAPAPRSAQPGSTAAEPIERRPYRIVFHFACHPSSRIDAARRADLLRDWQVIVRRFVGAPWAVSIAPASSPVLDLDIEGLEKATPAQAAAFEKAVNADAYDKVWVVHADRADSRSGIVFTGREYDTATRRLGPLQRRTVDVFADAPRVLLGFTLDLFSPTALISGEDGGKALLTVRGSTIDPASPIGKVVSQGAVFQPLRLISAKEGSIVVRIIPWTYLRVESVDGPVARCAIISGLNDPLSKRFIQPNTLAAVGIKPGNSTLRLRFVTSKDKTPGAGYTLTARLVPSNATRALGMTDRGGRIALKPGFADGLVILRLLAGNAEPVREFPVMPGESSEERTIPFDPRLQCVALEAEVDSLRDEVVDLIALRARLEARMKARLEGEDWEGLEEAVKEFSRLTRRDEYAKKLTELKDRAAHEQAETKTAILTKTAQAQINDLQAMIDRYLDEEAVTAYREVLETGRTEGDSKQKALAKAASAKAAREAAAKDAAAKAAAAKAAAKPATKTAPAATPKPQTPAGSPPKAKVATPPASQVPF
jgi:hypothetical protein